MKTRVPSDTATASITTPPLPPGAPVPSVILIAEDTGERIRITVRGNKQLRTKNLDTEP